MPAISPVADPALLSRAIHEAVGQARQARAVTGVLPAASIRPADTIRPGPHAAPAPAPGQVATLA